AGTSVARCSATHFLYPAGPVARSSSVFVITNPPTLATAGPGNTSRRNEAKAKLGGLNATERVLVLRAAATDRVLPPPPPLPLLPPQPTTPTATARQQTTVKALRFIAREP